MGKVSNGGRITFGFTSFTVGGYGVKVQRADRGTFITRNTPKKIRKHLLKELNRAGKEAEQIAKSPGHSPFLTGRLVRSIAWRRARSSAGRAPIRGNLTVGVPYGRRQEFEHKTRGFYLLRALQMAMPNFVGRLRERAPYERIIAGLERGR